jgi:hypothetical protein
MGEPLAGPEEADDGLPGRDGRAGGPAGARASMPRFSSMHLGYFHAHRIAQQRSLAQGPCSLSCNLHRRGILRGLVAGAHPRVPDHPALAVRGGQHGDRQVRQQDITVPT